MLEAELVVETLPEVETADVEVPELTFKLW